MGVCRTVLQCVWVKVLLGKSALSITGITNSWGWLHEANSNTNLFLSDTLNFRFEISALCVCVCVCDEVGGSGGISCAFTLTQLFQVRETAVELLVLSCARITPQTAQLHCAQNQRGGRAGLLSLLMLARAVTTVECKLLGEPVCSRAWQVFAF